MTTEYFTELGGLLRTGGMPRAGGRRDRRRSAELPRGERIGGPARGVRGRRRTSPTRLIGRDPEEPARGGRGDLEVDRRHLHRPDPARRVRRAGLGGRGDRPLRPLRVPTRPDTAMRWEYRRETAQRRQGARPARRPRSRPTAGSRAAGGCTSTYFKRPASASAGPAAALESAPAAPSRTMFFSAKFRALLVVFAVSVVLLVLSTGFGVVDLNGPGVLLADARPRPPWAAALAGSESSAT